MEKEILHSDEGYQLGNLLVTGLTHSRSLSALLRFDGRTYKACAKTMGCSADNVKNRIEDLYYEFHVNSTPALMTTLLKKGYLKLLTMALAVFVSFAHPSERNNRHRIARIHRVQVRELRAEKC